MKNLICAFACIVVFYPSFAQKCKEVVDPITSEKKYEYICESIMGDHHPYYQFSYEIKNGVATLTKEFIYLGAMKAEVQAGTELFFKLENGEVLKLKTTKEASPKVYGGYNLSTGYKYVLSLTKDDLDKLGKSEIVLIRIPKVDGEGYSDLEKKDDNIRFIRGKLKSGAACMSAYL